jgi:peptidoglycan hydrolase-like protein with peptidoglycan-binding domain
MPLPFYREIKLSNPSMTGNDVLIALTLLSRDDSVSSSYKADSSFESEDVDATKSFQKAVGLTASGVIDSATAQKLLDLHSADNYKDDGFTAASKGYLYKVHMPVNQNRSIETTATLFDANNNVLLTFPVRTHGYRDDGSHEAWPDFGDGDVGLNQFTSNGMTVTGLIEIDLNSAEPDPQV